MTDHAQIAVGRLSQQFKDKANVVALLGALISPAVSLDVALMDLFTLRFVDTSEDEQLSVVGRIVGQPRAGESDEDYRRLVRARVAVNRSRGTTEELINIADLVVYDDDARFVVDSQGTAAVVLRVEDVLLDSTTADTLIAMLRSAVSAGVRVVLESSSVGPDDTFTLDSALASQGFSEYDKLSVGTVTVHVNTVVNSTTPGQSTGRTLTITDDGLGVGQITDGAHLVFHFQPGVTTVADFEVAIATSAYLIVSSSGTGVSVMSAPADLVVGAALTGGLVGGTLEDARE